MFSFRFGIWARLLLAFGASAAITMLAVLMALFVFETSSDIFATLTEKHLPEVAQVAELTELGGQILAIAPSLASAPDEETQAAIRADLDNLLARINSEVALLASASPRTRADIELLVGNLKENLITLQETVAGRLREEQRLIQRMERLRWLYTDLLEEIEPLKQDLYYNLDAEIERLLTAAEGAEHDSSVSRLGENRKVREAVERIYVNGDFMVSLLLQASTLRNEEQIDNLIVLIGNTAGLLRISLKQLPDEASSITLRQLFAEFFALAEGEGAVFSIKKRIIGSEVSGQEILAENRRIVGLLVAQIDKIVSRIQEEAFSAAAVTEARLQHARWSQLGFVLLSLVTAASVMWFYVRGSIIARLNGLSLSMRAIAAGDLDHSVPAAGEDEIGQMAAALRVFRDTAQAVEEANAQAIIDNAAVGLIIAEADGQIRFFNPMAVTLFAAQKVAMSDRSLFSIVSEQERHAFAAACSQAFAGETGTQLLNTFQGVREDGSQFPIDVAIRSVQQRARRRLLVTILDVTEREQAHGLLQQRVREKTEHLSRINVKLRQEVKERRRVQDELVQAGKLAALGQLSAGIAHELNQPLSAIQHYLHNAGLLLQRGQLDTHEENLDKIRDLCERMAKTVNHLKNFARLPTNELQPVAVVPTIEHALSLFDAKLSLGLVRVERCYRDDNYRVYAEDIRLEQVLVNLIANAIDAVSEMPENERVIRLDIVTQDETLSIDVVDSGPGISEEAMASIFDPFYTTKEIGKGLGLGLSISYNIVKDMGGTINVSRVESGGTRFSLTLRRVAGEA